MANRTCTVEGCEGNLPAKGGRFCWKHYYRMRRYGDPLVTRYPQGTLQERFWAYVQRGDNDDCWIWTGSRNSKSGYGHIGSDKKHIYAHRFAYELAFGQIAEGLTIDHTCHNADRSCAGGDGCPHRACVNPAHLEAVPDPINIRRGQSPWARNARKTHCIHDHEFTPGNTYVNPRGERQCRTCMKQRARTAYQRKRALAASAG